MSRSVFAFTAGLALLASAVPAFTQNIYCSVTGEKQGTFETARGVGSDPKEIPVLFLTESITAPYDPATGQATGRRTHSPLIIVKPLDLSSIQFFNAATTNEVLRSVSCTFYRGNAEGVMKAYFRIVLTNAVIVEYADAGDGVNGDTHGDERERISFTYQKIELSDLQSDTAATDDWLAG